MTFCWKRRLAAAAAVLGCSALVLGLPTPAHAWWRGGFFIGVPGPFVFAPPLYAPPPVYSPPPVYAPPPLYSRPGAEPQSGYPQSGYPQGGYPESPDVYAEPPASYPEYPGEQEPGYPEAPSEYGQAGGAAAQSCFAGRYVCPLEHSLPVGGKCWCPTNHGARQWGQAG